MSDLEELPSPTSACYRSEVLLATDSGWYLVDKSGVRFLHRSSERLRSLCRTHGITPESGIRVRESEVFFLKTQRGSVSPYGKVSPTIQSFDVTTGGTLQMVEFQNYYRLYLAGVFVKSGRAYYWSGYELYEFTKDGKQKLLCKVRNPISSLAVTEHKAESLKFYYNNIKGNVFFHSCTGNGDPRATTSVDCGMHCHLFGSDRNSVFGWNYKERQLYVISNGYVARKRCWMTKPVEMVSSGRNIYLLFDGRIEIVDTDSLSISTLWNIPKGSLAVSESSRTFASVGPKQSIVNDVLFS